MSEEGFNWDDVLGDVEKEEEENPSSGGSDFESLPAGPYNVVVQKAEKQVATTGKDMIKTQVQVTEGPYANRVLFNYIVFSQDNPRAMRMTLERLSAFGLTREVIAEHKPSISQIADMLVGRKAVAVVAIQGPEAGQYEGRNEIKRFKPIEGDQPVVSVPAKTTEGVPNIPEPAESAPASAPQTAAPHIPAPDVPTGEVASAENPFGG